MFVNLHPTDLTDSGFDHGPAKGQSEVHLARLATKEKKTLNDLHGSQASMHQKRVEIGRLQAAYSLAKFCGIALAALVSLAAASSTRAQAGPSVEYQVKAAFLFSFTKFIEWPSDAFHSSNAPITLCVFRHDPFGSALDEIIQGKTVNNHQVLARRVNELPDLKSCQLVFVGKEEDKGLSEVLNSLKGTSALVVGETDGFAERGGGVQFFLEASQLRFAINVDAVQRARLTVSSKLLVLAKIVHDRDHPKGR